MVAVEAERAGTAWLNAPQNIFADDEYSKPYFVTYVNTAFFILPLIPMLAKHLYDDRANSSTLRDLWGRRVGRYQLLRDREDGDGDDEDDDPAKWHRSRSRSPNSQLQLGDETTASQDLTGSMSKDQGGLTLAETVKLSLEFCALWVRRLPSCCRTCD